MFTYSLSLWMDKKNLKSLTATLWTDHRKWLKCNECYGRVAVHVTTRGWCFWVCWFSPLRVWREHSLCSGPDQWPLFQDCPMHSRDSHAGGHVILTITLHLAVNEPFKLFMQNSNGKRIHTHIERESDNGIK